MKKLNRNYLSFYEALGLVKPDADAPKGYSFHGARYHDGAYPPKMRKDIWALEIYPGYQLLGAIRPFAKIGSDFASIVKPYYSRNMIKRDLLQPFRGIRNILKGIGSLIGGLAILALWIVALPLLLIGACIPFIAIYAAPQIARGLYPISWIIEGVANITRGALQLMTSPLNIIKMPVRGFFTWLFPAKNAEERNDIRRFAASAHQKLDAINNMAEEDLDSILEKETLKDRENRIARRKHGKNAEMSEYEKAVEKNEACYIARREVAALLFEVQHQYQQSVSHGWKTTLENNRTTCSSMGIFKQGANESISCQKPTVIITEEDIQFARQYLENFNLPLLKK